MSDKPSSKPAGVYAAVLTPLTRKLDVNSEPLIAHCRWLLQNGCDGLAPLGTTGEANSLSVRQRLTIIETLATSGLPTNRMIAGAGSCALADAVEVASAVAAAGCAGALMLPPFYYKKPTEDGLFAFFAEVIERVGDPRLRIYLYHFPQLSTVPITPTLIQRLMTTYPRNVVGLKDSSGDWSNTANLIKEFPGFSVFSGSEEFLLANLKAGGAGCISAGANVNAFLAQAVYQAYLSGAETNGPQQALTGARLVLEGYPLQAGLKQVVSAITGDPDWLNILPPNRPLSDTQARELLSRLRALPQMQPLLGRKAA
jgi:4-hydroxy-tetrahydrodipicolinate synthase